MSYESDYTIEASVDVLKKLYAENALARLAEEGQAVWYEYKAELVDFSKKVPGELITVTRIGRPGDYERSYFMDGKAEHVDGFVAYPPCTLSNEKDVAVTWDTLSLVMETAPTLETIRSWTDAQRSMAKRWAWNEHIGANDHDAEFPRRMRPAFIKI